MWFIEENEVVWELSQDNNFPFSIPTKRRKRKIHLFPFPFSREKSLQLRLSQMDQKKAKNNEIFLVEIQMGILRKDVERI